jgi:hypothetical protein
MARPTLRIAVPPALNALDQNAYGGPGANKSGVPSHAGLGREVSRNDRCLHANLRRVQFNQAFPVGTTPGGYRSGYISGERFGTFACYGTPGVKSSNLYFRAEVETSGTITVVPYMEHPPGLLPYRGMTGDPARDFQMIDGGAGAETTYGPFVVRTPEDAFEFGVVLTPDIKSTSPDSTGVVRQSDGRTIRGDSGAFVGFPTPTLRVVRAVDGAGNEVLGWRDVLGVSSSGIAGATNDVVEVWPRFRSRFERGAVAVAWEIKTLFFVDVFSLTLTENPLSGDLSAEF